ncbi:MAG: ferric reductase-like transmembrane domain-containing protein [Candidatus Dormiibacterota bacterium]
MLGFSSSTLWYLTRGSGLVLLVLLSACLVLGILGSGGWSSSRAPRFVRSGLHRNLALLTVALLVVHVLTAELDPYAPLGWLAVAVPFFTPYRALWLGLGTLSTDLVVAVIITSLLRARLGYRTWRVVHWLAYLSWPVALLHSLGTGTDTRVAWVLAIEILCLAVVLMAMLWRLRRAELRSVQIRVAVAFLVVAFPLAVVLWVAVGPLQSGWARSAGTPTSLLSSSRASAAGSLTTGGEFQ